MFKDLKEVLKNPSKPISRRKALKAGGEAAGLTAGAIALGGCATAEEEKRDDFYRKAAIAVKGQETAEARERMSQTKGKETAEASKKRATRAAEIKTRKTATAENERKSLEDELKEEMLGKYLPENAKITLHEDQQEYVSVGTMNHNVRSLPTTRRSSETGMPCKICAPYPCGEGHKINFGYVVIIEWDRNDGKGKHMERWGTQSLGSGMWLCIKQQEKMLNPPEAIVHFKIKE